MKEYRKQITHRNLGVVYQTLTTSFLDVLNPDTTSVFVEYNGDVIEVTKVCWIFHKSLDNPQFLL